MRRAGHPVHLGVAAGVEPGQAGHLDRIAPGTALLRGQDSRRAALVALRGVVPASHAGGEGARHRAGDRDPVRVQGDRAGHRLGRVPAPADLGRHPGLYGTLAPARLVEAARGTQVSRAAGHLGRHDPIALAQGLQPGDRRGLAPAAAPLARDEDVRVASTIPVAADQGAVTGRRSGWR
jgi:hypothetical protein